MELLGYDELYQILQHLNYIDIYNLLYMSKDINYHLCRLRNDNNFWFVKCPNIVYAFQQCKSIDWFLFLKTYIVYKVDYKDENEHEHEDEYDDEYDDEYKDEDEGKDDHNDILWAMAENISMKLNNINYQHKYYNIIMLLLEYLYFSQKNNEYILNILCNITKIKDSLVVTNLITYILNNYKPNHVFEISSLKKACKYGNLNIIKSLPQSKTFDNITLYCQIAIFYNHINVVEHFLNLLCVYIQTKKNDRKLPTIDKNVIMERYFNKRYRTFLGQLNINKFISMCCKNVRSIEMIKLLNKYNLPCIYIDGYKFILINCIDLLNVEAVLFIIENKYVTPQNNLYNENDDPIMTLIKNKINDQAKKSKMLNILLEHKFIKTKEHLKKSIKYDYSIFKILLQTEEYIRFLKDDDFMNKICKSIICNQKYEEFFELLSINNVKKYDEWLNEAFNNNNILLLKFLVSFVDDDSLHLFTASTDLYYRYGSIEAVNVILGDHRTKITVSMLYQTVCTDNDKMFKLFIENDKCTKEICIEVLANINKTQKYITFENRQLLMNKSKS